MGAASGAGAAMRGLVDREAFVRAPKRCRHLSIGTAINRLRTAAAMTTIAMLQMSQIHPAAAADGIAAGTSS